MRATRTASAADPRELISQYQVLVLVGCTGAQLAIAMQRGQMPQPVVRWARDAGGRWRWCPHWRRGAVEMALARQALRRFLA